MKFGLAMLGAVWIAAGACNASAGSICKGPTPRPGAAIHGPVLQIDDGSSVCIAQGAKPAQWSLVRLNKVRATRSVLMAATFGKTADCRIGRDGLGTCDVEGKPLSATVTRPEMAQAAWVPR
jgi:hypothetical protein